MAFGDYQNYQKWYTSKTTDVTLGTAVASIAGVVAVKDANHQLFIQKISYLPTTSAAQAVTFQDSNSTHLVIGVVPASQTLPVVFDYGPKGVPLTAGKNLDISNSAGPGAQIHIEAYERVVSGAIFVVGNGPGTQPGQ